MTLIATTASAQLLDNSQPTQQGVIISENAANIIKNNSLNPSDTARYNELKQTLYDAIRIAQHLPPEDADKIINSQYMKTIRKELKIYRKKITAINEQ